jgi:hypothetical protein
LVQADRLVDLRLPAANLPACGIPDQSGIVCGVGGFDQCYNAKAAVAVGSLLVVAVDMVQAPNDKLQLEPMLGKIGALPNWANLKRCWPIRAISVRRMSWLARKRRSNR